MPRPTLALPTAILAALALASCGGGSDAPTKAEFRTQYAPISAEIRELGTEVGEAVTAAKTKTDAALQTQFGDLAERTSAAADKLEAAQAPDDTAIRDTQAALVVGVKQAASDLAAISAAASVSDASAAKAATIKLGEAGAGVREPRLKLDKLVLSSN